MYSWYMPKDSPSSGLGHRHDWENVVVWLSSASTTATLRGVAISAHGDYQKTSSPSLDGASPSHPIPVPAVPVVRGRMVWTEC
jgi:hypothetical protein